MKTDTAKLRMYCEKRFPVGVPTNHARSVTGEEYVVIGDEVHHDELSRPGIIREGKERRLSFDQSEAVQIARASFDLYAKDKRGTLYWRISPQLEECAGEYAVYMRCLISDKGEQHAPVSEFQAAQG
jgi:hypothetical protein